MPQSGADAGSNHLRSTFDEIPELYDRARPRYPDELFADLVTLARLSAHARVLEIGCGTGQATVPLAERGFRIVCVELGEGLAAVARRNLAGFPSVEVVTAPFEAWDPQGSRFEAVVAFTAWHWIDPRVRYEKSADLLVPHGALALITTHHVLPAGGDPFFEEVQDDYRVAIPDVHHGPPPPGPDDVADIGSEIEASGRFGLVAVRRYLWDVTYTADEYIDVLDTYSGHRAFTPERRGRLYGRIRQRIEARPERTVQKSYLAILHVARRTS